LISLHRHVTLSILFSIDLGTKCICYQQTVATQLHRRFHLFSVGRSFWTNNNGRGKVLIILGFVRRISPAGSRIGPSAGLFVRDITGGITKKSMLINTADIKSIPPRLRKPSICIRLTAVFIQWPVSRGAATFASLNPPVFSFVLTLSLSLSLSLSLFSFLPSFLSFLFFPFYAARSTLFLAP